jgi:uncharacterized protein
MPIALDDPLTASEHKALARFLAKCASGVTPNLEALDGFFCALIVGPDVVLPSEYLPLVLGDHNRFDDGEEANHVLPLLMRHWNTIAQTLNQGEVYDLYLLKQTPMRRTGADWADAFMRGVELRYDLWRRLIDSKEHGQAILPMMLLAQEKDPELEPLLKPMPRATRNEMLANMTIGLAAIHRYFRERSPGSGRRTGRVEPIRRSAPKFGRNTPCPCGSGKKFKACCGAGGTPLH